MTLPTPTTWVQETWVAALKARPDACESIRSWCKIVWTAMNNEAAFSWRDLVDGKRTGRLRQRDAKRWYNLHVCVGEETRDLRFAEDGRLSVVAVAAEGEG